MSNGADGGGGKGDESGAVIGVGREGGGGNEDGAVIGVGGEEDGECWLRDGGAVDGAGEGASDVLGGGDGAVEVDGLASRADDRVGWAGAARMG